MKTPSGDPKKDFDYEEADAQLPNRRWRSKPSKVTLLIVVVSFAVFVIVASNLFFGGGTKPDEKVVLHHDMPGVQFHRTEAPLPDTKTTLPELTPIQAVDRIAPAPTQAGHSSGGSLFAFASGDGPNAGNEKKAKPPPANEEANDNLVSNDDPLTGSLRASNISKTAKAHVLKHARLVVPRGTGIPCNLKWKIDTRRPGIVVCYSKEEVRGWGGTVMLLPRWTQFTGQITNGLTVDQERADVVWTSVLTPAPDSIEITVNSPAADMLGAPGVDLQLDNHVGEKVLAVLLYTTIEAGPALAVQALQNQSNNNGSFTPYSYNQIYQPGQNVAGRLLERKLNRPPTGIKNEGEEVMVVVAQNWDLSDVISLEPVQ